MATAGFSGPPWLKVRSSILPRSGSALRPRSPRSCAARSIAHGGRAASSLIALPMRSALTPGQRESAAIAAARPSSAGARLLSCRRRARRAASRRRRCNGWRDLRTTRGGPAANRRRSRREMPACCRRGARACRETLRAREDRRRACRARRGPAPTPSPAATRPRRGGACDRSSARARCRRRATRRRTRARAQRVEHAHGEREGQRFDRAEPCERRSRAHTIFGLERVRTGLEHNEERRRGAFSGVEAPQRFERNGDAARAASRTIRVVICATAGSAIERSIDEPWRGGVCATREDLDGIGARASAAWL